MNVTVIAVTRFLGVPGELLGDGGYAAVEAVGQNRGSGCARLVEYACRACYDSFGRGRPSEALHQHLLDAAHGSCLEHASITFFISGVSRGLTHELVRHRVGIAISQRSTRYCDESESDWAWHPLLEAALREAQTCGDGGIEDWGDDLRHKVDNEKACCQATYGDIVLFVEGYLAARGVDKLTARKQARGAARGALGNALATELVWTANLRALRHFLEQRCSEFADAEIRLLAGEIYLKAREVCPEFFEDYERYDAPDGVGFCLKTPHRKV